VFAAAVVAAGCTAPVASPPPATAPAVSAGFAGDHRGTATMAPSTTTTAAAPRGPSGSGDTLTLAFAGDSYAHGVLAGRLGSDPAGFVGPFSALFERADLTVLNLETAITTGGTPAGKQFTFRAPASILDALRAGGVDVVSLANNHGMDYGLDGLEDTLAAKAAQLDGMVIGVGRDEDDAYAPYLAEIRGQRVAVLAATQVLDDVYVDEWTAAPGKPGMASAKREDRLVTEVERWRPLVDTLVVVVHWGIETQTCPSSVQKALARALVDAGADVIVGGHQHRVAGGGMLDGAFVHYGLGNFLFHASSAAGAETGVAVVEITGRQVERYEWVPGRIVNSVPQPVESTALEAAVSMWEQLRDCTDLAA
jgi:poly-gamma-glutamate capsule biosynthesis protein CapA/YwtB (metallophosphatase superfamily)